MTPSELQDLRESFDVVDVDGDGTLDGSELGRLFVALPDLAPPELIEPLRTTLDLDGDGRISFTELAVVLLGGFDPGKVHAAARLWHNAYDTDGSGTLDVSELAAVLSRLGRPADNDEVARALDRADLDGDRALDFAEFVRFLG